MSLGSCFVIASLTDGIGYCMINGLHLDDSMLKHMVIRATGEATELILKTYGWLFLFSRWKGFSTTGYTTKCQDN